MEGMELQPREEPIGYRAEEPVGSRLERQTTLARERVETPSRHPIWRREPRVSALPKPLFELSKEGFLRPIREAMEQAEQEQEVMFSSLKGWKHY